MELLLELKIVVIQDSEDGKRYVGKRKRPRKIVNCYRMFAELREILDCGRALNVGKDFKRCRPRRPSTASPWGSIPVRGQRARN